MFENLGQGHDLFPYWRKQGKYCQMPSQSRKIFDLDPEMN